MTTMDAFDQIGAEMIQDAETVALRDLARRVLRQSRAMADAIMDQAIALLAGEYRQARERGSVADILLRATPTEAMGAAPIAPARGPMFEVRRYEAGAGGVRRLAATHGRVTDQLSLMCLRAHQRHRDQTPDQSFIAPFTPGQIQMGLHYQALVERHDVAGMKCASVEARASGSSGGGDGGGFIEAFIGDGREIAAIRRRIGDGIALPVTRGAGKRCPITDRALVDAVCLGDRDLSAVLRAHGWGKQAPQLATLRQALAAALDRMQGYR